MTRETIEPGQWWRKKSEPYSAAMKVLAVITDFEIEDEAPIVVCRVYGRKIIIAIEVFDFVGAYSEVKESE